MDYDKIKNSHSTDPSDEEAIDIDNFVDDDDYDYSDYDDYSDIRGDNEDDWGFSDEEYGDDDSAVDLDLEEIDYDSDDEVIDPDDVVEDSDTDSENSASEDSFGVDNHDTEETDYDDAYDYEDTDVDWGNIEDYDLDNLDYNDDDNNDYDEFDEDIVEEQDADNIRTDSEENELEESVVPPRSSRKKKKSAKPVQKKEKKHLTQEEDTSKENNKEDTGTEDEKEADSPPVGDKIVAAISSLLSRDKKEDTGKDNKEGSQRPTVDMSQVSDHVQKFYSSYKHGCKQVAEKLSRIPLLGRIFGALESTPQLLPLVVIVFIAVIVFAVNFFTAPSSTSTVLLPDEGEVEVTSTGFNKEDSTLDIEAENIGGVIIPFDEEMKLYTYKPTINPMSWFGFKEVGTCVIEGLTVEDSTKETVSCTVDSDTGWRTRGVIEQEAQEE